MGTGHHILGHDLYLAATARDLVFLVCLVVLFVWVFG
jgi:hypothetical protein